MRTAIYKTLLRVVSSECKNIRTNQPSQRERLAPNRGQKKLGLLKQNAGLNGLRMKTVVYRRFDGRVGMLRAEQDLIGAQHSGSGSQTVLNF